MIDNRINNEVCAQTETATGKPASSTKRTPAAKKPPRKKATKGTVKAAEKKPEKKGEKKRSALDGLRALGGRLLAKMARGGAAELRSNAEEVNRLNVFPVPDGDTGDNMSMTIDSGVSALTENESDDISSVMNTLSQGMLIGARGNSGVILSQFFAGMAKGLKNAKNANPRILGKALAEGVEQAYSTVMSPTEGTILTVARESVAYANSRLDANSTVGTLFHDLVGEMHRSLDHTPELLPQLKEAGVVDSGGAGLLYIMDGFNRVLNGEEVEEIDASPERAGKPTVPATGRFDADSVMEYGYCTEALVQLMNAKCNPDEFDIEALRAFLATLGDSVVCFKTDTIVKLHVHTMTPERVLEYVRRFGELITVKIENMSLQHSDTLKDKPEDEQEKPSDEAPISTEKKRYGVVAVSSGEGFDSLFTELGCDAIVRGGQTNNPSAGDFIEAYGKILAEVIFVLPNNSNIMLAANMSCELYRDAKIVVIPTKSMGAGYAVLSTLALDAENPDDVLAGATEAIEAVTTGYVSPAIRDADMSGIHITQGDFIGIVDKEIVVSEASMLSASEALLDKLLDGKYMLTAFIGKDATATDRQTLEGYLQEKHPEVEFYFTEGLQDIYPFIFVAE
ncbi:MAG: DAK2 domain-containing protein [Clostridia bacterium]|nr:DAK2 domain-containing protein [Clostridia bacterium]